MLRLFVAIRVPPSVRQALAAAQESLAEAGIQMRWTRAEGIHLTLVFLGNVEQERVPVIEDVVRSAAATAQPFSLAVEGLGTFPPRGVPRVLWAGLKGKVKSLMAVQHDLDRHLRAAGFSIEDRQYSPHLTLARAGQRLDLRMAGSLRQQLANGPHRFGRWRVQEIELIRSQLHPAGSIYTTLLSAPLGGEAGVGDDRARLAENEGREDDD